MNPKISIIVPIYNSDLYLRRCLDSLINQTMKEIEIILIDDGSSDKSSHICDDYCKQDNRFVVFHQNRLGVSMARNLGIKKARGKYLMFVDSDDFVDKYFCKIPFDLAEANNSDLLLFDYKIIDDEHKHSDKRKWISDGPITKNCVIENLNNKFHDYLWNKLYRRELFNSISFPAGKIYEDISEFYKIVLNSENIYYCNSVLYYYFRHEGSIITYKNVDAKRDLIHFSFLKTSELNAFGYNYHTEHHVVLKALRYLTYFGFKDNTSEECCKLLEYIDKKDKFNFQTSTLLFLFNRSKFLFSLLCIMLNKRGNTKKYLLR